MWWAIAAFALLTFGFIFIYNRLVKTRNLLKEAWSDIDVQLKRRSELIPSLVETVRGYSQHEQSLLIDLVQMRATAAKAEGTKEKEPAENALTTALKNIFILAESYPDLKGSKNFVNLQKELVRVEDHIQFARRYYNGAVRLYNNAVESFPNNLVATISGFSRAEFFALELATEREAPEITWDGK